MNKVRKYRQVLRSAIGKETLLIRYCDRKSSIVDRTISPLTLGHTARFNRAVLAWCHLRESTRVFMLERIVFIEPTVLVPVPSHKLLEEARVHQYPSFYPDEKFPDPSCYGCQGKGTLQGFGSRPGTPCSCSQCCECGKSADHTDEGRVFCEDCHSEGY